MLEIDFAKEEDGQELQELLWSHGMGPAGEIEEHVILKKDDQILAGAKLASLGASAFHLEVIGVRPGWEGQGYGRILLEEILAQPWHYSNCSLEKTEFHQITTVSRGERAGFYEKLAFKACGFPQLPSPYNEQCVDCPDQIECGPVPMILEGGCKNETCLNGFYKSP